MKQETTTQQPLENDRVKMNKSTSVYNPHYYIEIDGQPAIHIYEDAFNSPAQAHNVATSFYFTLLNQFGK